ncbi:CLIP domain-containing serine protease 2 isoform X2 [Nilaparvata lugens]|uniref:CLIP domain-containing serine protease 2 isoform X2 n=1 Tax=Nilaparvata lugens TaxID=108931 RepID=UPI00193E99CE|nr:CLIP domain-containing serine protease 2 isoform X2 [Nilaparvata lugens]
MEAVLESVGMKIFALIIAATSIYLVQGTRRIGYLTTLNPRWHPNWHLVNTINCGTQYENLNYTDVPELTTASRNALRGEYPWTVLITIQINATAEKSDEFKDCMGTIITKRYVLTASSCFTIFGTDPVIPSSVRIRAGQVTMDTHCDIYTRCYPDGQYYYAESVKFNFANKPAQEGKNIALIKISRDIIFDDFVAPVCLEHNTLLEQDYYGEDAIRVSGWGINAPVRNNSWYSKLLTSQVKVLTEKQNDVVYNILPSTFRSVENYATYFCVGSPSNETQLDVDAGGPLVVKRLIAKDGFARFYLFGILSFKASIFLPPYGSVNVYTKVRSYFEWILTNIDA